MMNGSGIFDFGLAKSLPGDTNTWLDKIFHLEDHPTKPLFGAVSAVGAFGQVDFLEDGSVAVEREKKEVQSAPSLQLC